MEVRRVEFESLDNKKIPAFFVDARSNRAALIIHGYASSKNEMLGFGYEIAEKGYDTYVVDLRGHGDNENLFDEDVINDVEGVLNKLRERYTQILTVGYSLGGLLSLKSSSDYVIAISPPLMPKVVDVAEFMLRVNSCKVGEKDKDVLYRILENYNPPERKDNALIFYGLGESKGIEIGIKKWVEGRDVQVVAIDEKQATMPDVEVEAEKLKAYIPNFISHLSVVHAKRILDNLD
ncbi:hypothetical protein DRP05_01155 [Archaeoglobales archaeon]|nr:MAG: hypothetical protein DRP05_01155 [Archaeoglobales archaeon]